MAFIREENSLRWWLILFRPCLGFRLGLRPGFGLIISDLTFQGTDRKDRTTFAAYCQREWAHRHDTLLMGE
jgi:hypothetical protein